MKKFILIALAIPIAAAYCAWLCYMLFMPILSGVDVVFPWWQWTLAGLTLWAQMLVLIYQEKVVEFIAAQTKESSKNS